MHCSTYMSMNRIHHAHSNTNHTTTAHNNRSNDCQLVIQEPGLVNVTCLEGDLQWTKIVLVSTCGCCSKLLQYTTIAQ